VDIAVLAQILSSLGTLVVALGILYQGREARRARIDQFRPQILVDVDYTGHTTVNVVVRNIGGGAASDIEFQFSAPMESSNGWDITEMPYFQNGINFMAPHTDIVAVWDTYENVVRILREKGLTQGVTITTKYKDFQGASYESQWTLNPLLLEGSGYFNFKDFEDQVHALEDQARSLRKIAEDIGEVTDRLREESKEKEKP
jgi:hypothetical protein